jgi:hypothetical protein
MHWPFGWAHFIDGYASESNSTFIDFITKDLWITDQAKIDQLVTDMRDAIFFHSADKVESWYFNKISYTKWSFLIWDIEASDTDTFIDILVENAKDWDITIFYRKGSEDWQKNANNLRTKLLQKYPGLKLKLKVEEDTTTYSYDKDFSEETVNWEKYAWREWKLWDTWIEFQPIDLLNNPLAWIVRLADNMDMSPDRLIQIQRHPVFMNLLYNLWYEHKNPQSASHIFKKMEELHDLDKKLKKWKITKEVHDSEYSRITKEIDTLINDANNNGWIEITMFDEKTWKPKEWENNPFRVHFDPKFKKPDWKVDLYTYKQFIINEIAKHEDIELSNPDIQTIQNIAIDNDISSYSFRHFIWLTPIKDVTIESTETSKRLVVKVDKDIYLNPDLRSQKLTEWSFVDRPVVEYHIRRLFDASWRVTVDKKANYHWLLQLTIIDSQTWELIWQWSRSRPDEKFNIKYEDNIHIPDQIIEWWEID